MLNIKAVLLALVLCIVTPAQTVATAKTEDRIEQEKYWWPMLYPQLCGNGDVLREHEDEDVTVTFKILELFE